MDKYTFIEKLGKGTHGSAYLVKTHSKYLVCKSISTKNSKYALREIKLLSCISHKRIVKLIETFNSENYFFLILEHCNHNSLENVIHYHKKHQIPTNKDKFYKKIFTNVLAQITDALFYLKTIKIIHRDIKPSNILINQFFTNDENLEFKLCDFSLSTHLEDTNNNLVGTPYYMAPEIIKKDEYDYKVDIFSLGVVLYEMIELKRPFNGKSRKDLQNCILTKEINTLKNETDKTVENFIIQMLKKDKKERIDIDDLRNHDRIKYILETCEIRYKDKKIIELEKKIKNLEENLYPSPNDSIKK